MINIELGKTYRTRGGALVDVVRTGYNPNYPFMASNGITYTRAGARFNAFECSDDLIEEVRGNRLTIKRLSKDAIVPAYATSGSACFDLYACNSGVVRSRDTSAFRTGWAFEIPEDHVMKIYSRSGHGANYGVRLANCTGIIDSDYRGEVMVILHNDSLGRTLNVAPGDRIAQAMVVPVPRTIFEQVETLSTTERGRRGFGSSGL